jgi:hypothetical protein
LLTVLLTAIGWYLIPGAWTLWLLGGTLITFFFLMKDSFIPQVDDGSFGGQHKILK